jgi:hypothetical protein
LIVSIAVELVRSKCRQQAIIRLQSAEMVVIGFPAALTRLRTTRKVDSVCEG